MAIDIIARGLASSLLGSDGKIASDKMPVMAELGDTSGFFPVGRLTDASQVAGKTAEEILLMMLFGIVNPTLTAPSMSIALSEEDWGVLLVGKPVEINGTIAFDRGSINPSYNETSKYRAGAATGYSVGGIDFPTGDFKITLTPTLGENVIEYSVSYAQGDQPLNSVGQIYSTPLAAGALLDRLMFTAVYPLLDAAAGEKEFTYFTAEDGEGYCAVFPSESLTGEKQAFALHSDMTLVGIKGFNTLTQNWEWLGSDDAAYSLGFFDKTTLEGNSNYVLYTYNRTTPVGERELRIYVTY